MYSDKLEIYSFTDPEVAVATLNTAKIDVLLSSDVFSIDVFSFTDCLVSSLQDLSPQSGIEPGPQ